MSTQPPVVVTPEAAEAKLRALIRLLSSVEEFCKFQAIRDLMPKDSTKDDTDDELESLSTVANQATLLVRGSCEHLLAFTRSVLPPRLTIAPYACVRSSLESSALASWLTDQRVDRKERIGRSFALRFEGQKQQLSYVGQSDPTLRTRILNRIDQIECKAISQGYPVYRDANNKVLNIGVPWLGATQTAKSALEMDEAYRLLSAVTHGHFWAIKDLSYQPTDNPNILMQNLNPLALAWLCYVGAKSLSMAVWHTSEYIGVDSAPTQNILDSLYDELQITEPRIWR